MNPVLSDPAGFALLRAAGWLQAYSSDAGTCRQERCLAMMRSNLRHYLRLEYGIKLPDAVDRDFVEYCRPLIDDSSFYMLIVLRYPY